MVSKEEAEKIRGLDVAVGRQNQHQLQKTGFWKKKFFFLFKIKCAGHLPVERVRAPLVI
jgi:hypothetical protein